MQDPRSVERLRRGDVSALKRVFKSNHSKLYPLVFRLAHDQEATDHLIREAFRRLWSDRRDLHPFEVLELRLMAYAKELATEYGSEHGKDGIAYSIRHPKDESVVNVLEKLPERERLFYVLSVVDGYSARELASAFDLQVEEVRELVGAALLKLDEILGADSQPSTEAPPSEGLWP
jgi:DNA-directed RNA polymerase specialized sigma24 family protein